MNSIYNYFHQLPSVHSKQRHFGVFCRNRLLTFKEAGSSHSREWATHQPLHGVPLVRARCLLRMQSSGSFKRISRSSLMEPMTNICSSKSWWLMALTLDKCFLYYTQKIPELLCLFSIGSLKVHKSKTSYNISHVLN